MGFHANNGTEAGGRDVGLAYVDYLAHHPSTAERIARKLCVRFVSDDPPASLVEALAETYLDHDTAIVPVLERLFRSKAFASSVGAKVRRPFEDLAATLRILHIRPDPGGRRRAGGAVLADPGTGAPADGVGAARRLPRHRRPVAIGRPHPRPVEHARGARGRLVARRPPRRCRTSCSSMLPGGLPATYGGLVDALAKRLVFRRLPAEHRDAVLAFLQHDAADPLDADDAAVGWRLPYLVALILDTPSHGIR